MSHPDHGRRRAARATRMLVGASVAATAGLSGFVFAGTHTSAAAGATTSTTSVPAATPPSSVTLSGGAATAPRTSSAQARPAAPKLAPAQPATPIHATSGGS